ncbi:MAG: hypothetical protein U0166_28820 [Acidobacteriota bacterium]
MTSPGDLRDARCPPAWIAALALQHELPVLSRDEHFDSVPALSRVTW